MLLTAPERATPINYTSASDRQIADKNVNKI